MHTHTTKTPLLTRPLCSHLTLHTFPFEYSACIFTSGRTGRMFSKFYKNNKKKSTEKKKHRVAVFQGGTKTKDLDCEASQKRHERRRREPFRARKPGNEKIKKTPYCVLVHSQTNPSHDMLTRWCGSTSTQQVLLCYRMDIRSINFFVSILVLLRPARLSATPEKKKTMLCHRCLRSHVHFCPASRISRPTEEYRWHCTRSSDERWRRADREGKGEEGRGRSLKRKNA